MYFLVLFHLVHFQGQLPSNPTQDHCGGCRRSCQQPADGHAYCSSGHCKLATHACNKIDYFSCGSPVTCVKTFLCECVQSTAGNIGCLHFRACDHCETDADCTDDEGGVCNLNSCCGDDRNGKVPKLSKGACYYPNHRDGCNG